ncbi:MAG: carotenoid biosynthesis protein [Nitrospiraceae bacterium]
MDIPVLLFKTLLLRPYVFVFLAAALFCAHRLIGWHRTAWFFGLASLTSFICEYASTRTGIPFGWYHYTGSTVDQELYLSNIPFIVPISFSFLLFASYCLALFFLPARLSWTVFELTVLFAILIDMVIDPVALRGDRWFLGQLYIYRDPGIHFGVPFTNYIGWIAMGSIPLALYFQLDRHLPPLTHRRDQAIKNAVLLGCGLYYGVLVFNLAVTFWIGELLLGMTGLLIYLPITALFLLRLVNRLPIPQALHP